MSAKKMGVYLADDTLNFLKIIQTNNDGDDMNLSSAVNLAIQFAKLATETSLPMTTDELLLCCDVLNPGANLCEFDMPDSVSILNALGSIKFSLMSAQDYEDGIFEKWAVDESSFYKKIEAFNVHELFTLAIATRHFWSGVEISNKRTIKRIVDEGGRYQDWASQWVVPQES